MKTQRLRRVFILITTFLLVSTFGLSTRSPDTDPTWSAYTLFGNVKTRLELV